MIIKIKILGDWELYPINKINNYIAILKIINFKLYIFKIYKNECYSFYDTKFI